MRSGVLTTIDRPSASLNINTLIAGTGATTMTDSGAQGVYQYASGDGEVHIVNGAKPDEFGEMVKLQDAIHDF